MKQALFICSCKLISSDSLHYIQNQLLLENLIVNHLKQINVILSYEEILQENAEARASGGYRSTITFVNHQH